MKSTTVRLGIIGLGAMGHPHVGFALNTPEVTLAALCDSDPAQLERVRHSYFAEQVGTTEAPAISASAGTVISRRPTAAEFPPTFTSAQALIDSGLVDAILIVTPHYDHEPIALAAFQKGIHVLTEKPVTVTIQGARRMVEAWKAAQRRYPDLKFGVVFMQRTYAHWRKIKALIDEGELGRLIRTTWIITDWYRTEGYYRSGGWRATWKGEGGGVLTNQSPHNLDLLQWFLGMPQTITAFGGLGKYHKIAVEDEINAFLEYADGSTAQFLTSTAESPGTNRLEIVGENGKLVYENNVLTFYRNRSSMLTWSREGTEKYRGPECWTITLPVVGHGESGHRHMVENFARSILTGEPLVAPAEEGLGQVILTNAMMVSLLTRSPVSPDQADEFERHLKSLQEKEARS